MLVIILILLFHNIFNTLETLIPVRSEYAENPSLHECVMGLNAEINDAALM